MHVVPLILTGVVFAGVWSFGQNYQKRLEVIHQALQLHMSVMHSPKDTVTRYCRTTKEGSDLWKSTSCGINLLWRSENQFSSPCVVSEKARRYPPRYYRIDWKCPIFLFAEDSNPSYHSFILFR
jgi:hypothetical protein